MVLLNLIAAAHAEAAFVQPVGAEGVFGGVLKLPPSGEFPEEEQLGGAGGLAVNYTGAGEVPKGTAYVATRGEIGDTSLRVAEYRPKSEGAGLEFALGWVVRPVEGSYERCGPKGEEPQHEHCPKRVEAAAGFVDIDVDQSTGNVYVFSAERLAVGDTAITEFDANGDEVIARFGQKAPEGKSTEETPTQIHDSLTPGGLAVNGAGEVYVFDLNFSDNFYHRLMVFRPKTPGAFDEYDFAGEIASGFLGQSEFPSRPVADAAGNIYVAGETYVQELASQAPEPYPAAHPTPVCSFEFSKGGITSMTVDPASGEPFFFTSKKETGLPFKQIHQLSACSAGKFTEVDKFEVSPERDNLSALAFDPRGSGTLYGAAPGPKPGAGGPGQPGMGSLGYIFVQAPEDPPTVDAESLLRAGERFAEVSGLINAKSHPTTYFFEYLSAEEYLANGESFEEGPNAPRIAPAGGGDAGNSANPVTIGATLTGLAPGTEYRFRVRVANHCKKDQSIPCEDSGEAVSFRTFSGLGGALPENRAWELVSPAQKSGGQVLPPEPNLSSCIPVECKPGGGLQHFPMQSAPDGESVAYEGTPFAPGQGAVIENSYLAHRTPSGWQSTNLTPSLLASKGGQGYKAFQGSLGAAVIEQLSPPLAPGAPAGYANLYLQASGSPGALTPLISEANATLGCAEGKLALTYAGASPDFSRQFFQAGDALTPEAVGACGETNVYEWSGGALRALNILPGETETAPGAVLGSGTLLETGNPQVGLVPVFEGALAAGGGRVFWTAASGQLFVEVDGGQTVEVPGPGNCRKAVPLAQRACFLVASASGAEVLLSNGHLYALNETSGAYEETLDLSAGKGGFLGLVGHGEGDLSHLYFADTEVLAGENGAHQSPVAGKDNLYALAGGSVSFIATLANTDSQDWLAGPPLRTAQASRSGRFLAFLSRAEPTGYDNVGPCELTGGGAILEVPCSEAYLYDSDSGQLRCASCNPTEAAPIGKTVLPLILNAPAAMGQPRYLTDSGRLYFDSRDSLVPTDTNNGVEDVYQFQAPGTDALGACGLPAGCVSLLSAGRGSADSNWVAIDEDGANVFFTSRDRLVPEDTDNLSDLYDARVGGGFAPPSSPSPCQAEACQAPQPPPAESPPNSAATGPPENFKPPKCKKNQVRRGDRCVAKPKKHKHKKHKHKHKGQKQKQGGAK